MKLYKSFIPSFEQKKLLCIQQYNESNKVIKQDVYYIYEF